MAECPKGRVKKCVKKETLAYESELRRLQVELLKFQNHVKERGLKVLMIFEGRDAAGKGGTIKRIIEHLNPRGARVVALEKPTEKERSQWYFQRYVAHLPSSGEMVFFDRSYYNRAGVEPVMGFCTKEEQKQFLKDVSAFEKMLVESDTILLKYYISVSKEEQARRLQKRREDPLKQYKISPIDEKAQEMWDGYTIAKYSMLMASHTKHAPWTIIKSDNKKRARINTIKNILSRVDYPNKIDERHLKVDSDIVIRAEDEIINLEREIQEAL
jgi:polyphosphate kinase 2